MVFAPEWKRLLTELSQKRLSDSNLADLIDAAVRRSGWLGYDGADDITLTRAEHRLGITLPPSYRAFLTVSNGFREPKWCIEQLLPVENVRWFRDSHPEEIQRWCDANLEYVSDDRYFKYGLGQSSVDFREEYLQRTLQISSYDDPDDGGYLLNAAVMTDEGDWEAWYFSGALPGAMRFRTFWDLMAYELTGVW